MSIYPACWTIILKSFSLPNEESVIYISILYITLSTSRDLHDTEILASLSTSCLKKSREQLKKKSVFET